MASTLTSATSPGPSPNAVTDPKSASSSWIPFGEGVISGSDDDCRVPNEAKGDREADQGSQARRTIGERGHRPLRVGAVRCHGTGSGAAGIVNTDVCFSARSSSSRVVVTW